MRDAIVAIALVLLIVMLSGGVSCSVGVRNGRDRPHTCIESSTVPLMSKKYECTDDEFRAQNEG